MYCLYDLGSLYFSTSHTVPGAIYLIYENVTWWNIATHRGEYTYTITDNKWTHMASRIRCRTPSRLRISAQIFSLDDQKKTKHWSDLNTTALRCYRGTSHSGTTGTFARTSYKTSSAQTCVFFDLRCSEKMHVWCIRCCFAIALYRVSPTYNIIYMYTILMAIMISRVITTY